MIDVCQYCGIEFDCLKVGKLRMGQSFCSLECADLKFPEFFIRREREKHLNRIVLFRNEEVL
jgi:hypothetical protein